MTNVCYRNNISGPKITGKKPTVENAKSRVVIIFSRVNCARPVTYVKVAAAAGTTTTTKLHFREKFERVNIEKRPKYAPVCRVRGLLRTNLSRQVVGRFRNNEFVAFALTELRHARRRIRTYIHTYVLVK